MPKPGIPSVIAPISEHPEIHPELPELPVGKPTKPVKPAKPVKPVKPGKAESGKSEAGKTGSGKSTSTKSTPTKVSSTKSAPVDVSEEQPIKRSPGRPRLRPREERETRHWIRHPWEKWFSKKTFTLTQGVDYHGRTNAMIQQVRNQAGKTPYGLRVSVDVANDEKSFTVYILGPQSEVPAYSRAHWERKQKELKKQERLAEKTMDKDKSDKSKSEKSKSDKTGGKRGDKVKADKVLYTVQKTKVRTKTPA